MKYAIAALLGLIASFTVAFTAQAITTSWDYNPALNIVRLLAPQNTARVVVPSLTASSSATNTLPVIDVPTRLRFGGITGVSWSDFCTAITGSAALCDGNDATGGGGGGGLASGTPWAIGDWVAVQDNGTVRSFAGTSTVRGMFSASSPLSYNSGTGAFTFSTAGDWTGTFDGQEGSFYLSRANHTGTQLSSTISDLTAVIQSLSVGTTSAGTVGNLAFWTGARTLGNVATGTLTENSTGLSLSGSPVVIGGSSVLTIDAGFALASTTGLSNLYTFYDTPSSRITAGTGLSWSGNTLNATGGGSSNWTDNGTFLSPLTSTDGLLVTGSSTFSRLQFDNATTTGSLWLGSNRIWQHPAQFLDIQRTGSDYTLARIRAPRGSSREATLALVVDLSTTDAGVDEEFVDFYNERYGDSLQWGLRQAYSGAGIAKPFVIGHWQTSGSKDAGNKLIVMPHGTVAVARATSTIPLTTAFYVASSTAPNLVRFDSTPGTAEFVVENDGDTGVGTSTPSAALSVVAQVASTIANFFSSTGSLVMSIASNLVTIFGDTVITGDLYVASSTYYGATTSDAITAMGYLNSGNWINEMCTSPTAEITQVAADVLRGCGRFSYLEDAAGVIDFVRPQTGSSTYFRLRPGAAGTVNAAGDGMAIGWADGVDMGDLQRFEPAMEFALKQDNLANATATMIFAGITDKVTVGVDAATEPGVGFYVIATTTANWLFACNPATGGTTYIDTGIASSSFATGNANPWTHFRLEVGGTSNTAVEGLLKARVQSTRQFTQIGVCSINLSASTAAAAPIVAIGKTTAGQSPELHVPWVKFWYYNQLY